MRANNGDLYEIQRAIAVVIIAKVFEIPSSAASDVLRYSESLAISGTVNYPRSEALIQATVDTIQALTALSIASGRDT